MYTISVLFIPVVLFWVFLTQFLTPFAAACKSCARSGAVVFDVDTHGVIAVTPVLGNTGGPPPPGLSGGAPRVTNP